MDKFDMGEMVFAATDLYNDELAEDGSSLIPGVEPNALIAPAGARAAVQARIVFGMACRRRCANCRRRGDAPPYSSNFQSRPASRMRRLPVAVSRNTTRPSAGKVMTTSKWPWRR